jgi:hypothetical protein
MNYCVIMHNIIIESGREANVKDDQPFDFQGPLAQVNDVPTSTFLAERAFSCKIYFWVFVVNT